ncbi:MAG: RNA polymerase sigma factor [Alloacidobacterium sp.]|jgi:RNA polymerase sigma-70 factor (ECF subfamily)
METIGTLERASLESWSDQEVIARVKAGDTALYEIIMRRYNQRLYRVTRAILRDDAEAEDVIQDAYVRAYQHLDQFAGSAAFSTWLTRIAVHEALRRLHLRDRSQQLEDTEHDEEGSMSVVETSLDPEQRASLAELGQLLEEAVLDLPDQYRTVIMLRDIDELSTAETAAVLDLTEQNVKVRLHRGRAMMRDRLFARVGGNGKNAFPFMGSRCDRVVIGVFARLRGISLGSPQMP